MVPSSPRELETPPAPALHVPGAQRDMWLTWLCSFGPTLWFLLLVSMYASSQHECEGSTAPVSWALLVTGGLSCGGAILLLTRERKRHRHSAEIPLKQRRILFMVSSGLLLNAMSLLLLAGFAFPLLWLRPCE